MAAGSHPFPFRTRKLSLPAPMVLGGRLPGRVGRRRNNLARTPLLSGGAFVVLALRSPFMASPSGPARRDPGRGGRPAGGSRSTGRPSGGSAGVRGGAGRGAAPSARRGGAPGGGPSSGAGGRPNRGGPAGGRS